MWKVEILPEDKAIKDQVLELFIEQVKQKEYYKNMYSKQREEIKELKERVDELTKEKVALTNLLRDERKRDKR